MCRVMHSHRSSSVIILVIDKDGVLTVTHVGGANKTRVNNKPLADNVPQPVQIGDKIAFGKVVMRLGALT